MLRLLNRVGTQLHIQRARCAQRGLLLRRSVALAAPAAFPATSAFASGTPRIRTMQSIRFVSISVATALGIISLGVVVLLLAALPHIFRRPGHRGSDIYISSKDSLPLLW